MRAYETAAAGDRVLVTGGLGSTGGTVAAVATLGGLVTCVHALRGTARTPDGRILRGGPDPPSTVNLPLGMALAAWTTHDVDRIVPLDTALLVEHRATTARGRADAHLHVHRPDHPDVHTATELSRPGRAEHRPSPRAPSRRDTPYLWDARTTCACSSQTSPCPGPHPTAAAGRRHRAERQRHRLPVAPPTPPSSADRLPCGRRRPARCSRRRPRRGALMSSHAVWKLICDRTVLMAWLSSLRASAVSSLRRIG